MTLTPGRRATASDRAQAELLQELAATQLDRVRKAAEGWRTGLAALIALITTVSVVKGENVITDLPSRYQWTVGGLVFAALITAAIGAYLSMRAAYGLPRLNPTFDLRALRKDLTRQAIGDLTGAIILAFVTLGLLAAAVGFTWYGQKDSPGSIRVATDTTELCGSVKRADGSTITVQIGGAERDVALRDVRSLSVVRDCE